MIDYLSNPSKSHRWLVLLGMAACQGDPPQGITTTDSAGVRLTLTTEVPKQYGHIDPDPVVSLGSPDASGPTQFAGVQNVFQDGGGQLWVADGQSSELRLFSSDGAHLRTLGGRGDGPGEFRQIRLLGTIEGDTVVAADRAAGRVSYFAASGQFIRTNTLPAIDGVTPRVAAIFPDGSLLGQLPRVLQASDLVAGQILVDSARLVRIYPIEERVERITDAAGPLWIWTGRNQVPVPFTNNAGFVPHGGATLLVSGPDFRVRQFTDGRMNAMFGIEREPRQVSPSDIESYRAFVADFVPEGQRSDYLMALDSERLPSQLPAYARLVTTPDGILWARVFSQDFGAPATWHVYSSAGRWLGEVLTPADFTLTSVAGERIAGIWRDELGVEHVRVYRVVVSNP